MRRAVAVLLAVVAGPVAAGGPAVGAPGGPTAADGVDGVWRSDGYGTVLAFGDGRLREYQTTAVSCLPGDSARFTGHSADGAVLYTGADETVYRIRAQGRGRARLHIDGSVGDRRLRRLPALPVRCTQAKPAGARATFDVFPGETLTQALMQRPAFTVRVGQNAQGVFSDILTRTLPNGWTFGLPDEE
ncbi:hypothetical protein [Streptomyces collinus]|uniref:hypothetical protein n=1 Tax=Streptomyces collinus TaxID=42684 RepID=UPI0033F46005